MHLDSNALINVCKYQRENGMFRVTSFPCNLSSANLIGIFEYPAILIHISQALEIFLIHFHTHSCLIDIIGIFKFYF